MKSEQFFRNTVIAGISSTELLSVSKIPGNTNPNKYTTATIEIIIRATGYIIAPTYYCLMSFKYAYSSARD